MKEEEDEIEWQKLSVWKCSAMQHTQIDREK